jgi:hypothetical protein
MTTAIKIVSSPHRVIKENKKSSTGFRMLSRRYKKDMAWFPFNDNLKNKN